MSFDCVIVSERMNKGIYHAKIKEEKDVQYTPMKSILRCMSPGFWLSSVTLGSVTKEKCSYFLWGEGITEKIGV